MYIVNTQLFYNKDDNIHKNEVKQIGQMTKTIQTIHLRYVNLGINISNIKNFKIPFKMLSTNQ